MKNNDFLFLLVLAGFSALTLHLQEQWDTNFTEVNIADADNTSVASAANAVEALLICLWEFVFLVD